MLALDGWLRESDGLAVSGWQQAERNDTNERARWGHRLLVHEAWKVAVDTSWLGSGASTLAQDIHYQASVYTLLPFSYFSCSSSE